MSYLYIGAGIEVEEGKDIEKTKRALNTLAEHTLQEPGCLQFIVLQQLEHPNRFTLWEAWQSEAALQLHFQLPHTKDYLAQALTKVIYIERLRSGVNKEAVRNRVPV